MNLREYIQQLSPEEMSQISRESYAVQRKNSPEPPPLTRVKPPEYVAQQHAPNRSALAFWEKWSRNA